MASPANSLRCDYFLVVNALPQEAVGDSVPCSFMVYRARGWIICITLLHTEHSFHIFLYPDWLQPLEPLIF